MLLGANATVDYLAARVRASTPFTATIQTFLVENSRFSGTPQLNLTQPTQLQFEFETDFTVREGSGVVSGPVAYLAGGGCSLGDLTGKIALFESLDRPCGYVLSICLIGVVLHRVNRLLLESFCALPLTVDVCFTPLGFPALRKQGTLLIRHLIIFLGMIRPVMPKIVRTYLASLMMTQTLWCAGPSRRNAIMFALLAPSL